MSATNLTAPVAAFTSQEADDPFSGSRQADVGSAVRHHGFIDALRGVAILSVIVAHAVTCTAGLPAIVEDFGSRCSAGVQLFFALSAYTLCCSFEARAAERHVLGRYALRRVFRIVPMFWFAIALFVVVNMYANHWGASQGLQDVERIVLAALLLHGFDVYAVNSVVPAGWSVAVEAQFYLLLPFLIAYATTLRRTLALVAGSLLVSAAYVPAMEGVLAPLYSASEREIVHQFAYFSLPTQLPMFTMGMLAYRLLGPDRAILARLEAAVPLRPIAIGAAILTMLPLLHSVPGHLGYGVMAIALIYSCAHERVRLLDNAFTRYFGKISYSAYLVHFAVLFLLEAYAGAWLGPAPLIRLVMMEIVAVALIAGIASATYALIEQPGIALGRSVARRLFEARRDPAPASTPQRGEAWRPGSSAPLEA